MPSLVASIIISNNDTFCGCSKFVSVIIPNSVTSIGNNAFYYCSSLLIILSISSSSSIASMAFAKCTKLEQQQITSHEEYDHNETRTMIIPIYSIRKLTTIKYKSTIIQTIEQNYGFKGNLNIYQFIKYAKRHSQHYNS
mmetsp:Transcript_16058/g.18626  ORF Transcript_16058/g.18626 Transcript_16058/m.18626 type:complete len:139 (+) Transcript_16058:254-670(+)